MATLDSVGVASTAKFMTLFGLLVGLVAGILYSVGGAVIDALVTKGWVTTTETPGLSWGTVLAFGAILAMPGIFGVAGFLIGTVGAILYNLAAKWVGGIEIHIE